MAAVELRTCQICQFDNPATAVLCSACSLPLSAGKLTLDASHSTARASSPPPPAADLLDERRWACPSCTFSNNSYSSYCAICGTPQSGAPSPTKAVLPPPPSSPPIRRHMPRHLAAAAEQQLFAADHPATAASPPLPALFDDAAAAAAAAYPLPAPPSPQSPLPVEAPRRASRSDDDHSAAQLHGLYSLSVTVHHCQDVKQARPNQQPYVLAYLHSSNDVILLSRSPVAELTVLPSSGGDRPRPVHRHIWEHTVRLHCLRPTDALHLEVRDLRDSIRDPFLGETERFTFHYAGGAEQNASGFVQHERSLSLFPRPGQPDSSVTGSLLVSYLIGPPQLDLSFDKNAIPRENRLPDFDVHSANYGVALPNFRDVGGWPVAYRDRTTGQRVLGYMKSKMLFRSSAIHRATEHDSFIMHADLHIRSLIDLRTLDMAGNRGPFLTDYFRVLQPITSFGLTSPKLSRTSWSLSNLSIRVVMHDQLNVIAASEAQKSSLSDDEYASMKSHHALVGVQYHFDRDSVQQHRSGAAKSGSLYIVSLVGSGFQLAIMRKSSKRKVVLAGLTAESPQAVRRAICAPIFDRSDGLSLLYRMLIKHSTFEICLFFLTLLETPSPAVVFCNHGKDRTGLLVALLQSLCGVARESVVNGYSLSEHFLIPIKDIVDQEMTDAGQDPKIMSRSPAQAMSDALDYIDRIYGGVPNYLNQIGFTFELQALLRKKFVESSADTERGVYRSGTVKNLKLVIIEAQNLPETVFSSTLDSYVVLKIGSTDPRHPYHHQAKLVGATPTQHRTLDPVWNQPCHLPPLEHSATLVFEIWKANRVRGDRIIGFTVFELDQLEFPFEGRQHFLLSMLSPTMSTAKDSQSRFIRSVSGQLKISLEIVPQLPAKSKPVRQ